MGVEETTLRGKHVILEPLRPEHAAELWLAADHRETWRYMTREVASRDALALWIEARRASHERGRSLPFLQRDAKTKAAIGATSIFDIDPHHRRMEIGFTFLAPSHQGTLSNKEAKYLLLSHCFDGLDAIRVQLKTDARNARARRAILAIGAKEEGVLRKHDRMPDGTWRDAVVYSIIGSEWPAVKLHLETVIAGRGARTPNAR